VLLFRFGQCPVVGGRGGAGGWSGTPQFLGLLRNFHGFVVHFYAGLGGIVRWSRDLAVGGTAVMEGGLFRFCITFVPMVLHRVAWGQLEWVRHRRLAGRPVVRGFSEEGILIDCSFKTHVSRGGAMPFGLLVAGRGKNSLPSDDAVVSRCFRPHTVGGGGPSAGSAA